MEKMGKMGKKIITVSREFGSGGRTVGRRVAELLGMAFYDKELVDHVAMETGFDPLYVEEEGELASSESGFGYSCAYPYGTVGVMRGMSAADFLWTIQREVILQLADKAEQEPCVIVGRCADYILKDRDDCLHAFIHASMAFRADRIVRLYGSSESSPEARLQEKDKRRKINYKHYTDREWGMSQNYHVSLDSSVIGVDRCADVIASLAGYEG
jgi:cytidylate kinase